MSFFQNNSLYLVSSEEYYFPKTTWGIAQEAVYGGIDVLQMREKNKTYTDLLALGKKLADLCKKNGVLFIVNDNPQLAFDVGADGVHLGQEDLRKFSLLETREILGKNKIIGVSTHSVEEFELANQSDSDYIAFGPIFSTKAKDYAIGLKNVENVLQIAKKPVFFIGGIDLQNVDLLLQKGAKNFAVIRSIACAVDISGEIKAFYKKMRRESF